MENTDDYIFCDTPFMIVSHDEAWITGLMGKLAKAGLNGSAVTFNSERGAAAFLNKAMNEEQRLLPQLLFFDLQMRESAISTFFCWLRSEPMLDGIAVIPMSCAKQAKDIAPARRLGSDFYLQKHPTVSKLRHVCEQAVRRRRPVAATFSSAVDAAAVA